MRSIYLYSRRDEKEMPYIVLTSQLRFDSYINVGFILEKTIKISVFLQRIIIDVFSILIDDNKPLLLFIV